MRLRELLARRAVEPIDVAAVGWWATTLTALLSALALTTLGKV